MNRHGRLGIYLPVLIISILATVTLRTVACFLYYDTATGYFDSKTLIGIAFVRSHTEIRELFGAGGHKELKAESRQEGC